MDSIPTELKFSLHGYSHVLKALDESGMQLGLRAIVPRPVKIGYVLLQEQRTLKFQWLKVNRVYFSLHMLHVYCRAAVLLCSSWSC